MINGFGTINFGRFSLRETYTVDQNGAVVSIAGQDSITAHTKTDVERLYFDILSLRGKLIPVTFSDKAILNAYYIVAGADVKYQSYPIARAASPSRGTCA